MSEPLRVGQSLEGFKIDGVFPVPHLRATAYRLTHSQTGARLLHLHVPDDSENLFSVSFPTPPTDDTGVPHILEHAVLSGSRKYPVRDPFFEMVKMSMATFINAMTGWDVTYYPVASNVKKDLFNLAEVYFDAVFHPLLTAETFEREGHHLAPADPAKPTGDLSITGIVYNEMKGAFSHPESRLYRVSRALFPDTQYRKESGGDPEFIPDLTHQGLVEFHRTFYHPSNAYFYLYGDVPTGEFLRFLRDKLATFTRLDVQPKLRRQPRWTQPQRLTETYPAAADESLAEKTYLVMHWLVGDSTDPLDHTFWRVLDFVLLGNEAAPLRKALVDSKLGQAVIDSGVMPIGLENTFRVGLKGSEPDRHEPFEKLVLSTLAQIASQPIKPDLIRAAFQQAAYHYLEVLPMFPLHTMERVLDSWIYGGDPLTFLGMSEHLQACRAASDRDPELFNRMIRERLVDNPHRLSIGLRPDREMQPKINASFAEAMRARRAKLSDDQMLAISTHAAALEEKAAQPNTAEQLATLPQLQVGDLPPRPREIPTTVEELTGGVKLLRNDVFANGVSYFQFNLDLTGLPDELWSYLPRYCEAISKLGAAGLNYEQMAHRIATCTGGIACQPVFATHATDPAHLVLGMRFGLKTLDEQIEPALAVLRDVLFGVDPRDVARLRDVVTQALTAYRSSFVYDGHATAMRRAARGQGLLHRLGYEVNGLPQLEQAETLHARFDEVHADLMARIEQIREFLLVRGRLTASFTGSDRSFAAVRRTMQDWSAAMRPSTVTASRWPAPAPLAPAREGLAAPIDVAYCVQSFPGPHFSHPDEPLLVLGARMVGADYILSEVRFKGNAYGAWFRYDQLGSTMTLSSYRDPHVVQTLEVFKGVSTYVDQVNWQQVDVDRAIIGSAKDDEKPIRPGEATGTALQRELVGITSASRADRLQRLRRATPGEVKRALRSVLEQQWPKSSVCVVASREKLEKANGQLGDNQLTIEDILKR